MLKNIILDIILLYKNFFFWFKVKFFSWIFSIILWILVTIPTAILTLFYAYTKNISTDQINIYAFDFEKIDDNFLIFLIILNSIFFIIWFFYCYFFLGKFYLELLEKRKRFEFKIKNIFKNFFDFENIKKFLWLTIIYWSIIWLFFTIIFYYYTDLLSIPAIKGSVNMFLITWETDKNIWYIAFLTIILLFILIYFSYKIIFSYFYILDEKNWIFESIKKSFKSTSLKKFTKIILCLFIVLFPFLWAKTIFQNTILNLETEQRDIFYYNLLKKNPDRIKESDDTLHLYNRLDLKYFWANDNDLKIKFLSLSYTKYFLIILEFLFVFWTVIMIFTSIYKNIIKQKND